MVFSKSWPYFNPKYVIFHAHFQTYFRPKQLKYHTLWDGTNLHVCGLVCAYFAVGVQYTKWFAAGGFVPISFCRLYKNIYLFIYIVYSAISNGSLMLSLFLLQQDLCEFIKRRDTLLLQAFRSSRTASTSEQLQANFKQYLSGMLCNL